MPDDVRASSCDSMFGMESAHVDRKCVTTPPPAACGDGRKRSSTKRVPFAAIRALAEPLAVIAAILADEYGCGLFCHRWKYLE